MVKVKELSMNLRQQIMNACNWGTSFGVADKQFSVPKLSVPDNMERYHERKNVRTLPGISCKPELWDYGERLTLNARKTLNLYWKI